MTVRKVGVVVGSNRKGSVNLKLARALMKLAPKQLACEILRIDDLPVFNQDHDQNPPEPVVRLKAQIQAANGIVLVTPEYNRSIPAALKNALDWASRPYGQNAWAGKPVGIAGASIGAIGTAAVQQHLRSVLGYLDMPTLGQPEVYIHFTDGLIDTEGEVSNAGTRDFLQGFMDRYAGWVERFATP